MDRTLSRAAMFTLETLYDTQEPNFSSHIESVVKDEEIGRADEIVDELETARYLKVVAAGPCVEITTDGRHYIERVRRERDDPSIRLPELRRLMLRYLYDTERSGLNGNWSAFLNLDTAELLASRFTESEVKEQAEQLTDKELIFNHKTTQSPDPGWFRPALTTAGRECVVEHGGNVANYLRAQKPQVGNIYNVVGQAAFSSQQFSQTMTNGADLSAVTHFAETFAQIVTTLPGLSRIDQDAVRTTAVELSTEIANPQQDASNLKRLTNLLWTIAEKAGTSAATPIILDLGHKAVDAIQHLPT